MEMEKSAITSKEDSIEDKKDAVEDSTKECDDSLVNVEAIKNILREVGIFQCDREVITHLIDFTNCKFSYPYNRKILHFQHSSLYNVAHRPSRNFCKARKETNN